MAVRRKGRETRLENDDILQVNLWVNLRVKGLRPSRLSTVTLPSVEDLGILDTNACLLAPDENSRNPDT